MKKNRIIFPLIALLTSQVIIPMTPPDPNDDKARKELLKGARERVGGNMTYEQVMVEVLHLNNDTVMRLEAKEMARLQQKEIEVAEEILTLSRQERKVKQDLENLIWGGVIGVLALATFILSKK